MGIQVPVFTRKSTVLYFTHQSKLEIVLYKGIVYTCMNQTTYTCTKNLSFNVMFHVLRWRRTSNTLILKDMHSSVGQWVVVSIASNTLILKDMHSSVGQWVVVSIASNTLLLKDMYSSVGQWVVVSRASNTLIM